MDWQTVAIGIGLIVSLLFTEAYGLSAGGMIVPGYLALQLHQPWNIAITLAVAAVTFLLVSGVSRVAIIYGRRRIVLTILAGFVIGHFAQICLATHNSPETAGQSVLCVIGCIVPGLIALWFDRQGLWETTGTVLTASAVVRLCLVLFGMELMV
jgi:poly-gamma-glutamate biosynthesis protein PgsC/CapC